METFGIPDKVYRRRWVTLAVLVTSLVLVVIGVSVVNVALPTFARELAASPTDLQWIVGSYALVFGGLLLSMGAIGDRWGRRGALLTGLVIFGAASAASMAASAPSHVILWRSVAGIGAALVMPATLSTLSVVFPPHERGKAFGIWAAFAGLGGALGPLVGGWIIDNYDWSGIFAVNLPVVALGIIGVLLFVPTSRDAQRRPLDPVGALLSMAALGGLLYGIIEGSNRGWTDALTLAGFALALITGPLFVWWERRTAHPMLPMEYFRSRGFTMGNAAIALMFLVMFAFFFIVTQYLQFVREYTAFETGYRMLPFALGLIVSAPNSDKLSRRVGTPGAVTVGLAIVTVALIAGGFLEADTPYWILALGFFLMAIGMGLAMAPATTIIMDNVPSDKAGVGSAMNDTSREAGGAIGIAALGSILNESYQHAMVVPSNVPAPVAAEAEKGIGDLFRALPGTPPETVAPLIEAGRDAFMEATRTTYAWAALVVIVTALLVRIFMPMRESHHSDAPLPLESQPVPVPAGK